MKKEIIKSCYNELINEISDINKQIQEINSKIEWNHVLQEEERDLLSKLINCEHSLLSEKESLNKRINNLNCAAAALKEEVIK